ncbi:N-acetylmuramoyl-L-alanine amidase CwlD [Paenibacillus illinoisensis]|uniref:N-acetylmuramoyl-L-alanine amidase n=1 Tax=Paenibacillus illinoisensis TaxID=59845 RepID=UPI0034BBDB52
MKPPRLKKSLTMLIVLSLLFVFQLTEFSYAEPSKNEEVEPSNHFFRHPAIIIDAGHGGIDGGTSFDKLLEKDINLSISQKMYMILKTKGYNVVLNRNDDYALSEDNTWSKTRSRHSKDLAQRKGLSDHLPSDIVVSIHVNWGKKTKFHGPIVLHQKEAKSYLLANAIQDSLNEMYQTNRLVIWGKPFYLLNHINKPSVIVETGFISNPKDRLILSNVAGQKKIAQAISSGIIYYLSVM